jgi:hypothetical protein
MSNSPEAFHEHNDIGEPRTLSSGDRTPLVELERGDLYRWAALDVADLDPPTPVLPYAAS